MTMTMALPRFETFLRSTRQSLGEVSPMSSSPRPLPPLHTLTGYYPQQRQFALPETSPVRAHSFHPISLSWSPAVHEHEASSYQSYSSPYSPAEHCYPSACSSCVTSPRPVRSSHRLPTKATTSSAPTTHRARRVKKKYLKEQQRCEIVRRVRAGEKQAHLAKEFGVSRAAVCYLLKHELEILERFALHKAEQTQ